MSGETRPGDHRLRIEWLGVVAAAALLATVGGHLVAGAAGPAAMQHWLLVTGTVLAAQLGYLGYLLVRAGERAGPAGGSLGSANAVTILRGMLYAVVAGFVFVQPTGPIVRWAPGLCYGAGAALDFVDGQVAKRADRTSELGARLDHAFDTLGFLVAPLVGVAWGRLPVWYLSLSAARYCFRAGLWWRRRRDRPVYPLPDSEYRRRLAAFQMAFIAVALVPVVPSTVVQPAATVALLPSLAVFGRDWLAVSGRLSRYEE